MGRGYKDCPKCRTQTGCRTRLCTNCGYDFKSKKVVETTTEIKPTMKKDRPGPPSLEKVKATPKKERLAKIIRCSWHPDYDGQARPKDGCAGCWSIYLRMAYGLDMVRRTTDHCIRVTDPKVAADFIASLKICLKSAIHAGGAYSAFLPINSGEKVQIEVQVK